MIWLFLLPSVHAACRMAQFATPDGASVVIEAVSEPLSCRRVTLLAAEGLELSTVKYQGRKVRKDHILAVPGGYELAFPELEPGEKAEIGVKVVGGELSVILGERPAPEPAAGETHTVWTVGLDPKHPGWGFADKSLAFTRISEVTLNPDGRKQWEQPGAAAQGVKQLFPGSFTLDVPGARVVGTGSEGVEVSVSEGKVRWDAPAGGTARWRVSTVAGDVVIPDERTYVSGLDWRWSQVSLPEPAPPTSFRASKVPRENAEKLYNAVRTMNLATLPGADPLRPRHLNRAWKSGFGSSVEMALVLDRLVRQQQVASTWVLSGENPDPITLTGYDRMFALVQLDNVDVPLDPACAVCAFGELSTELAGKAAIGGLAFSPLQAGTLVRTISLVGTEYRVVARLEGAAALWLREKLYGASGVAVTDRVGQALGMVGATIVKLDGLETLGASITVELTTEKSVKPPFVGEPPWVGGWRDE